MSRSFDDCFAYDRALIPVADAQARLRAHLTAKAGTVTVTLDQAQGRYLAEPLQSPRNVPAFDNVAVDGWAVRFDPAMAQTALTWPIQPGRAAAGHPFEGTIMAGHALRVLTGAVLPTGANTVILQEECRINGDHVRLPGGIKAGANCRPAGEDITAGETLFAPGHQLRPQDIGAAALMGYGSLPVFEPIKMAVFSTGDEVIEPGSPAAEGAVYDANRPMLKALLANLPVDVTDLGRLADDAQSVAQALHDAADRFDVVLTSGGASQGDEDHIARTLTQHGTLHFWRIALKPGRPMAFGQLKDTMFIGLPGNPVAAFVCFQLFAKPVLARLGGGHWPVPKHYPVTLAHNIKKRPGRLEMVRATVSMAGDVMLAHKIKKQGSGVLTSLVEADGLLALDHDLTDPPAGTIVPFWPFET